MKAFYIGFCVLLGAMEDAISDYNMRKILFLFIQVSLQALP